MRGLSIVFSAIAALFGPACATSRVHAPAEAPRAQPSRTVLLVHGMFVTPRCWDPWVPYLESRGYRVLRPAWPGHDEPPAQARAAHPDPQLAALDLAGVVAHYRRIIEEQDEPPILIGHSMGGLVVQLLLSEGYGAAGVAIDAAPPKGVFTLNLAFLKSNGRVLRGDLDDPLDITPEQFGYMFTNTYAPDRQREIFEAHARPESRRVARDATTDVARIDFRRPRPPLLLLGGERDHTIPPVLGRKTWRRYRKAPAITEYREIAGADHWLIGGDLWQQVADVSLDWVESQSAPADR